jgi:hypothetical protein
METQARGTEERRSSKSVGVAARAKKASLIFDQIIVGKEL